MLELRDLGCERGGRRLFRGINATIESGRLLRIEGQNGAGKSSLMRIVCGLLAPSAGEIRWGGERVTRLREEFNRHLIYCGHAAGIKDDLTATENLASAARLAGWRPDAAQIDAALDEAGLQRHRLRPGRTLSQGQRRRVGLARLALALAMFPRAVPDTAMMPARLWVLDEPFTALDTAATAWLVGLIRQQLDGGGIVVLSSHQSVGVERSATDAVTAISL